jgi:hypothetical protein
MLDVQVPLPGRATASGGGGTWGSITGTLSNQTDLQAELDAKAETDGTNVWTSGNEFSASVTFNVSSSVGFEGTSVASGLFTFGGAAGAANSIALNETSGCITWEGSTADTIEGRLCVTDPTTSDKTWTLPNLTGTVPLLEVAQTFSGIQTFSDDTIFESRVGGSPVVAGDPVITINNTAGTTRTLTFGMHTDVNVGAYFFTNTGGIHLFGANSQIYFNGTATSKLAPALAPDSTQSLGFYYDQSFSTWGMSGGARNDRVVAGITNPTLVEGAATGMFDIRVGDATGCAGEATYSVWATDGTDHQIRGGSVKFAVVNKANAETCTLSASDQTNDGSILAESAGGSTLTYNLTCVAGTNQVTFKIEATSSLTQTQLKGSWAAFANSGAAATGSCDFVGY